MLNIGAFGNTAILPGPFDINLDHSYLKLLPELILSSIIAVSEQNKIIYLFTYSFIHWAIEVQGFKNTQQSTNSAFQLNDLM